MKRSLILIAIALMISTLGARITVLEKSTRELIVEFNLDDYQIIEQEGYSQILMNQMGYPSQPGMPSLPTDEFKIGIPPHGGASFQILSRSTEHVDLPRRLIPVPHLLDGDGSSEYHYEIDEELYRDSAKELVESLGTHVFREHPYQPFVIHPFSYDGERGLSVVSSARIRISLQGDIGAKSPPSSDAMADLILGQMLNGDDAKSWIQTTRTQINHADFSRSLWWIKIETDAPGMYRINPSQLGDIPVEEIDPRSFRLFSTFGKVLPVEPVYPGEEFREAPILVKGEEDGSFDPGDYIAFYGIDRSGYEVNSELQTDSQKIYHNPYTNKVVYWLTFAGDFDSPPLRIQSTDPLQNYNHEADSFPETVHVEEEKQRRDQKGYTWYMTRMFGSSTQDYAFDVTLPDLDASQEQLLEFRIRQEVIGSDLTHSINVFVNGEIIPSSSSSDIHQWYSTSIFNFSKATSAFHEGNNRILIRVIRNKTANLFLDYYRVTYNKKLIKTAGQFQANAVLTNLGQGVRYHFSGNPQDLTVFKISNPGTVCRIPIFEEDGGFYFTSTGGVNTRFVVTKPGELLSPLSIRQVQPTDLSGLDSPVQNLIITPAEFEDSAHQLAGLYQQNWNLYTKVVIDTDIFDQFNGGHPDPAAIRQYLRYHFHYGAEPKIESATFLGLGTLDWRNFSGAAAAKNKMMIFQDPSTSITSDDYFALFTNESHPEIVTGRYPVTNQNELQIMISNLIDYTQNPSPGLWHNSMVFLADDEVNGPNVGEWTHTIQMQAIAEMVNPSVFSQKIFAAEYEYDEFLNKPLVRDEFFESINEGKLIWYYVGHGGFDKLGMQNYLASATDMGKFQNQDRLGLFIAASCEVSTFDHWAYESLGQKTVLMDNRGAIASVGSTRKSFPGPNHALMTLFLPNMVNDRQPLGWSLLDAKIRHTGSIDNDAMYIIMGDPNLRIVPPQRDDSMSLIDPGRDDDTLYSRQRAQLEGSFSQSGLRGEATFIALDTMRRYKIKHIWVSQRGPMLFRGGISVEDSDYSASFIVPDDVMDGDLGVAISYIWDDATEQGYVSYYHPMHISSEVLPDAPPNDAAPDISIYLSSYDFRAGDTVSTSPVLYARISDENGVNVTGSAGHNILLVLDNSLQPIPVTDYFVYDTDSYQSGTLSYPLPKLSEGPHSVQIIAFDNHNLPSVAETHFISRKSGDISLENLLPYPNPMKDGGHITFIISADAEINLDIFSMSGRRIRRIKTYARQGFNQIPFDGRDEFGARLANNTYFIRVRARTPDGKSIEKRERLVIYK